MVSSTKAFRGSFEIDGGISSEPEINSKYHVFKYLNNGADRPRHWALNERAVTSIIDKMTHSGGSSSRIKHASYGAGYTYLGQMITHDITRISNAIVEEEQIGVTDVCDRFNFTPYLDLGSIYPVLKCDERQIKKYKDMLDREGRFRLGHADENRDVYGTDLYRFPNGKANIPEQRNDENVIISQLHLFWQKIHNSIVEDLLEIVDGPLVRYDMARQFVTLLFQEVVVRDFLKKILADDVYEYAVRGKQTLFLNDYGEKLNKGLVHELPREFSMALFRFGHSMVRAAYAFGPDEVDIDLSDIFHKSRFLDKKFRISWDLFFSQKSATNLARILTMRIAQDFLVDPTDGGDEETTALLESNENGNAEELKRDTRLEEKVLRGFKHIALVDILASRNRPTGADLYKAMCSVLSSNLDKTSFRLPEESEFDSRMDFEEEGCILAGIGPDGDGRSRLTLENVPLWLFMLREAETYPVVSYRNGDGGVYPNFEKLGHLSSAIVAETLMMSISGAETNIYSDSVYDWPDFLTKKYSEIVSDEQFSMESVNKYFDF